jgi:hypothetical protein
MTRLQPLEARFSAMAAPMPGDGQLLILADRGKVTNLVRRPSRYLASLRVAGTLWSG